MHPIRAHILSLCENSETASDGIPFLVHESWDNSTASSIRQWGYLGDVWRDLLFLFLLYIWFFLIILFHHLFMFFPFYAIRFIPRTFRDYELASTFPRPVALIIYFPEHSRSQSITQWRLLNPSHSHSIFSLWNVWSHSNRCFEKYLYIYWFDCWSLTTARQAD